MKFYSELLDKMFETEMDLVAAEEVAKKEEAKKKKASEAKKAEAQKVEDAFKKFNAAKKIYNENILNLKKQYNADLNVIRENLHNLKTKHEADVAAEAKLREDAEAAYKAALDEFIKKHPEGYHMTLKDGDHVITISSSTAESRDLVDQLFDPKFFWDEWMKLFRF